MSVTSIGLWEMRVTIKSVRDRVLSGETFLCLYRNKVKAELKSVEPNTDLSAYPKRNRINMDSFRVKLTKCWQAIEKDPKHPGFVICLYGEPWGLFTRSSGRSQSR